MTLMGVQSRPALPPRAKRTLDDVIRQKYVEFGIGADKLVSYSDLSEKFAQAVVKELPNGADIDSDAVRWRVMTLRKRGEDHGGLPRLERTYNGRVNKPR